MASWKRVLVAGGDAGTPSALVGTNITGTASGFTAGAVTNGVYTTGNQTIAGTKTFSSTISGSITGNAGGSSASCTGNAASATYASKLTITDNESTAESNLIPFVADASATTGNHSLEMDGDFSYSPNTGRLKATELEGEIVTSSQTNITGVGTLTAGSLGTGFSQFSAVTFVSDDTVRERHFDVPAGGSNDDVLTKDSTEGGGIKWAAPAAAANDGTLTLTTSGAINGSASFTANQSTNSTFTVIVDNGNTSQKGVVQLQNSTSSTSTTKAATPAAVKSAYDLANGKVSCDETNVSNVLAALDGTDTLYIGDAGNDATINIRGNLTVSGTTTSINTTELTINDNKVVLNNDASTGADAALVIQQGTTGDDIEFMWDQSAGNFTLDSQGVAGTTTSSTAMVTCLTSGVSNDPSNANQGHGSGSMYVTSTGAIWIYS